MMNRNAKAVRASATYEAHPLKKAERAPKTSFGASGSRTAPPICNRARRTMTVTIPHNDKGCPDLQALVDLAGRRHAASIGEQYVEDPFKRPPHHGGYQHADWRAWDEAVAGWRQDYRDRLCRELETSKRHHHHHHQQLRRYRGKERRAGATQRS